MICCPLLGLSILCKYITSVGTDANDGCMPSKPVQAKEDRGETVVNNLKDRLNLIFVSFVLGD